MQLNKVFLAGNLTRDPQLKYTPQGSPIGSFSVAVSRKYKSGDALKEEVSFVNCVCWGSQAEKYLCKFAKKGSPVHIEGRIQVRQYEHEGQKRTATEIVVEKVQILFSKSDQNQGQRQQSQEHGPDFPEDQGQGAGDSEVPF